MDSFVYAFAINNPRIIPFHVHNWIIVTKYHTKMTKMTKAQYE